jgi:hypothetical protein
MITFALALLRALARDRAGITLTLLAPVAFFTLIGGFYQHLERPDGLRMRLSLTDDSGTADGRRLARAIQEHAPTSVLVCDEAKSGVESSGSFGDIRIMPGFRSDGGRVQIRAAVPFPGGVSLIRQSVEVAMAREFSVDGSIVNIETVALPGRLLRDAAAGVCVGFMMFSIASFVARGLADDAAGLVDRMRSLGFGTLRLVVTRCIVLTLVGSCQAAITLWWGTLSFGISPGAPMALLATCLTGAFCLAAFFGFVAAACGTRARFAAVAPVMTLSLAGISGAFVPRFLLPESVATVGALLFPAWMIDACRQAIEGGWPALAMVGLVLLGLACLSFTAMVSHWTRRA